MNNRRSRVSKPRNILGALVLSLAIVLASGGDWVFSSFEDRVLSDREENLITQSSRQFLLRASKITGLDATNKDATELGPVTFSDYFGYSVEAYSDDKSLEVLLDCDSQCVTTYKDKASRNLLAQCGSLNDKREGYVNLSEAKQIAVAFIEAQGQAELLMQLAPERSALKCFSSEEYFQFVWREQYDEEKVAFGLVRVEVLVNPANARVYRYQFTESEIDSEATYSPGLGRHGALNSVFCGGNCSVEGMALFSLHHRDESSHPAWAVRVTNQVHESHQSTIIFVDAETGVVIPSSQPHFGARSAVP